MLTSSFYQSIMREKPTGYWKLDEYRGSTAFDFSNLALNNPLMIMGGITLGNKPGLCSDWPHGCAIGTSTSAALIGLMESAVPFTTYGALTILALISPSTISSGSFMSIARLGSADNMTDWAFGTFNKKLRYQYYNGSVITKDSADNQLALNTRAFVAMTRAADGKTINFYLNGALISGSPIVAASAPVHGATPDYVALMGGPDSSGFLGSADEIAVFIGTEMNANRIANLYADAIRIWPSGLPLVFSDKGYKETIPDTTRRTEPAVGEPLTRPQVTDNYRLIEGTFDLYASQRETIESFYQDTLNSGTMTFEASLRPGDAIPGRYLFLEPTEFTDLEGGDWEASCKMIEFP